MLPGFSRIRRPPPERASAVLRGVDPAGQPPAGDENLSVGGLDQRVRSGHRSRAHVGVAGVPAPDAVDAGHRCDETLGELPLAVDELVLPHLILRQRLSQQFQKLRLDLGRQVLDLAHHGEGVELPGKDRAPAHKEFQKTAPTAPQLRRRRLQKNRSRPLRLG